MNISRRELNLVGGLLVVALVLVGFLVTRKQIPVIKEIRKSIVLQDQTIESNNAMIALKDDKDLEYLELSAKLPVYPSGRDVKSDLLSQVDSLASKVGLRILNQEEDSPEKQLGDSGVYQFKIGCTYEGTGESLLKFLYESQSAPGLSLDVSYLRFEPHRKLARDGIINGRFTVDCAYRRQQEAKAPDPATPGGKPPASTNTPAPESSTVPAEAATAPGPKPESTRPATPTNAPGAGKTEAAP